MDGIATLYSQPKWYFECARTSWYYIEDNLDFQFKIDDSHDSIADFIGLPSHVCVIDFSILTPPIQIA